MRVNRFSTNPILHPGLEPSIGTNLNGPSLLRVPDWLPNPLGQYYLYFAHHQGKWIRLAYADRLEGPWRVHAPGTLQLDQTPCMGHIASPDVHVDQEKQRIVMYYHGPALSREEVSDDPLVLRYPFLGGQRSFVAFSSDGIHFESNDEILGPSYFRVFHYGDWTYALAMPGIFLRSADGFSNFEVGPTLFDQDMRHSALLRQGDRLHVFFSRVGDVPERILCSTIDLSGDWMEWSVEGEETVIEPKGEAEGAHLPLEPSQRGAIHEPARQLRDPAIFVEDDTLYLLYSLAGESGIGIALLEI